MKSRDDAIAFAFRNVDTKDVEWLVAILGDGGHGRFWKSVMREVDSALRSENGQCTQTGKSDANG